MKSDRAARILDRLLTYPALSPIGIFLVIFGCKLWLIHACAVSCPFWDEWDVQARGLYKPWIENQLPWTNFLAPHNEHRLLMPRLAALALWKLNGFWDPKLQMILNAALHSFAGVLIFLWFKELFSRKTLEAAWTVLVLAVFALPIGWENTLMGLQTQVSFFILFAMLAVRFFSLHEPLSLRWFLGVPFALAAYFSMASGILAASAGAAVILVQIAATRTCKRRWAVSLAILAGLFLTGYYFIPSMGGPVSPRASSPGEFLSAFAKLLAGPDFRESWIAFPAWFPFFAFLTRILRPHKSGNYQQGKDPSKEDLLILGLGFLILLQAAALAYGRGESGIGTARYYDLLLPGVLVNFAAIAKLLDGGGFGSRQGLALFAAFWGWIIVSGFWGQTRHQMLQGLKNRREINPVMEANVKGYLATGDLNYLKDKLPGHIPYPAGSWKELKELLDDPAIRSVLPSSIRPAAPARRGEAGEERKDRLMPFAEWLLKSWIELVRPGLILLLLPFFYGIFKNSSSPTLDRFPPGSG